MKSLLCLTFLVCLLNGSLVADEIHKSSLPSEVKALMQDVPDEIKGLQWNRWTSDNFTVLAINDTQAQYLHKHLELIKSWIYSRWGFVDTDFSSECKLVVVDDPELFEKMFRIRGSRVEVRRVEGGINETVIFLLVDDSPSNTVPIPLSEICFAEMAAKYNTDFGWWAYRGMSMLNGSLDQIRGEIIQVKPYLDNNQPMFFSKGMMETTKEAYAKLSKDKRDLYDRCSLMMCLIIRKEFGQTKFHRFLKISSEQNPETAIKEVLGFDGYADFDSTFKRYMIDITRDVQSRETPNHYLQINPAN